ncbi:helix-turn-helix transcriptional regulator [Pacificimonas sp. WHA3]|uniref:Helix-turn-helix transcriptional regulator n=1 Tax=Pacificimonas pallii TaxID=2827236 RepID=A0ABS6SF55_9SPHN|nr:AraC family transcriptional regulator [Pacificimonas pallii]MBV7256971.1 helix-turn-helix transcriptional regulator [Pacificimonas pallii]
MTEIFDMARMQTVYGAFNAALGRRESPVSPVHVVSDPNANGMLLMNSIGRKAKTADRGYWEVLRADDDLLICAANDYYDECFHYDVQTGMDVLSIRFIYAGELGIRAPGEPDDVCFSARTASVLSVTEEMPYELLIRERRQLLSVTLHLSEQRLWEEVGFDLDQGAALLNALQSGGIQGVVPMTAGMNNGVLDILSNRFSGGLRGRYMMTKAQELLCLLVDSAQRTAGLGFEPAALTGHDRERVRQARSILLDNFIEPPSADSLARQVGLNRTTLRRGFKEQFGQTIAHFCHQRRMHLARQLLADPIWNVAAVAEEVGYSQPTNFTAAFRRYFGALPKDFRRH